MSNFFSFIGGTLLGMYLAQNYQVPDIKTTSVLIIKYLKSLEKEEIQNNNDDNNDKYKGKYK